MVDAPQKQCPTCGETFASSEMVCPNDGSLLVYPPPPEVTLAGAVLDGRYRITEPLAAGGMGQVYRAVQLSVDREVAIKVLKRGMASSLPTVQRFQNEARAASRLKSPHTVTVHDFGQEPGGQLYLVMELVKGETIADLIRREGVLHPERAIIIAMQVLESLKEAHELGIIHRDIKPSNVMLTRTSMGDDHAKVTDFGIAKLVGDENAKGLTTTGILVGTPSYISPERIKGLPTDHRSDLYSVGVLLYEMLQGGPPFAAHTPTEVLLQQLVEAPRELKLPPGRLKGQDKLVGIVEWAMGKNPDVRPQSAAEFHQALASLKNGGEGPDIPSPPTDKITLPDIDPVHSPTPDTPDGLSFETQDGSIFETQDGSIFETQDGSIFETRSAEPGAATAPADPPTPEPTPVTASPPSPSADTTQAPTRRALLALLGIAGLGLGALLVFSMSGTPTPEQQTAAPSQERALPNTASPGEPEAIPTKESIPRVQEPAPPSETPTQPSPTVETAVPESRQVTIQSQPPGAQVKRGDEIVGETPLELTLAMNESIDLRLFFAGYHPQALTVDAQSSETIEVELSKKPEKNKPKWKPKPKPTSSAPPPTPPKEKPLEIPYD